LDACRREQPEKGEKERRTAEKNGKKKIRKERELKSAWILLEESSQRKGRERKKYS
jgi:hypothetical protein